MRSGLELSNQDLTVGLISVLNKKASCLVC